MWCSVYFSKMKFNVMYIGEPARIFSKADSNLVNLRNSKYPPEIGINTLVLKRRQGKLRSVGMEAI